MSSVNKVILLGRLGQDPELKYTNSGTPLCTMSIATSEVWKDQQGQKQEKTEWHRVVVWGKQAENCNQYLSKGSLVYVEGKNETRSWEDKNNVKRYSTQVIATSTKFISTGQQSGNANSSSGSDNSDYSPEYDSNFTADDIPF